MNVKLKLGYLNFKDIWFESPPTNHKSKFRLAMKFAISMRFLEK